MARWRPARACPPSATSRASSAVSRPSLREALIALEIEGLLDVRVGSGIYVTQPGERANGAELADASRPVRGDPRALADRGRMRGARREARHRRRRCAPSARRTRDLAKRKPSATTTRSTPTARSTCASPKRAATARWCWWCRRCGTSASGRSTARSSASSTHPALVAETLAEHQAIVDAVAKGDARAARAAARRHMDMTKKRCSKEWKKPHEPTRFHGHAPRSSPAACRASAPPSSSASKASGAKVAVWDLDGSPKVDVSDPASILSALKER